MQMCARYEVFLIKPVARTVHRLPRPQDDDDTQDNSQLHRLFGITAK